MEDIERKFKKYLYKVKELNDISDSDKLYLYGNYKQVLNGDINIEKPSMFNIIENAKWNSWNSFKGISKEKAINNYIKKVKELFIK
jgi:diazepam-binding inhibitor (GABA receptor modulating acyl-CoA-binding protein)